MTAPDLIGLFVAPIEEIGVTYMITGGVASVIYGDPRFTRDVDIETALRADVYLAGRDPLMEWAFDRRLRLRMGGGEIWVAPIEYVIVRKLEYSDQGGSDRHLRDVAMMLRISGDTVDSDSLLEWCDRLDLRDILDRAGRFSPE